MRRPLILLLLMLSGPAGLILAQSVPNDSRAIKTYCRPDSAVVQQVIKGHFAHREGAVDTVILCDQGIKSMLQIVWAGESPTEGGEVWNMFKGDGQNLGVRHIATVNKRYITKYVLFEKADLPRIDHDGILDRLNRSLVHYYDRGRWFHLHVRE